MSADNWRELLDDPQVQRIVPLVARIEGRKVYPNTGETLLLDDVESYLWDGAVSVAESSSNEPKTDAWYAYLYGCLRLLVRQHRYTMLGPADSPRRNGEMATSSLDGINERHAETGAYGHVLDGISRSGPNYLFTRRLSPNDPLGQLLYLDRLTEMLHAAEARTETFASETSGTCAEPLCMDPPLARGLCSKHYLRLRYTWGVEDTTPRCRADGCPRPASARGWCDAHYRQERHRHQDEWREQRPDGCSIEGCDRPHKGHGLCHLHLRRSRLCAVDGCENTAVVQGMCKRHHRAKGARS